MFRCFPEASGWREGARDLRRFLIGFGVCAALVIVVLVGGFAYLAAVGGGLDAQAKSYAEGSVTAITSHWDAQALLSRASEKLRAGLSPDKSEAVFEMFNRLGALVVSHGCNGQASMYRSFTGQPSRTEASYTCTATYRNGDATLNFALVKDAGGWAINGFHVNSDVFQSKKPPASL